MSAEPHSFPSHESAKQRALRIPLEYVTRSDGVRRAKFALAAVGCLVTGGYVVWICADGPGARQQLLPGPVAVPHARWELQCEACHQSFVPLRNDSASVLTKLPWGLAIERKPDLSEHVRTIHSPGARENPACITCHAGPVHHANERPEQVERCVSCHLDHLGRKAEIGRPADSHCVRCHGDISGHRLGSKHDPPIENVIAFAANTDGGIQSHPEFRSLQAADPGNIKFNHHLHMTPGLPAADARGQGKKLLTLADLPAESVNQYRRAKQRRGEKADSDYLVQLECSTCHRPESNVESAGSSQLTSTPSDGAYMAPIRYEQHCQACHPLYFEPSHTKQLKHGLLPAEIATYLAGHSLFDIRAVLGLEKTPSLPSRRPMPGQIGVDEFTKDVEDQALGKMLEAKTYLITERICLKCHSYVESKTPVVLEPFPSVLPAKIPRVWFRHALFDHGAHRTFNCRDCHEAAYVDRAQGGQGMDTAVKRDGAQDAEIVMIKGRDSCLTCHSAVATTGNNIAARNDCAECHRYHGRSASTDVADVTDFK